MNDVQKLFAVLLVNHNLCLKAEDRLPTICQRFNTGDLFREVKRVCPPVVGFDVLDFFKLFLAQLSFDFREERFSAPGCLVELRLDWAVSSFDEDCLFRLILHHCDEVLGLVLQREAYELVRLGRPALFFQPCLPPLLKTLLHVKLIEDVEGILQLFALGLGKGEFFFFEDLAEAWLLQL